MTEHGLTEAWVNAAKAGNQSALTKLLTTYHARLRARAEARMPAAMKSKRGPDDILQEVYLDVFRQVQRFENRGPGSFLNWLCAILDHKLAAARRDAHAKLRDLDREVPAWIGGDLGSYWDLYEHLRAESPTPSGVVRRQEALEALRTSLSGLAAPYRQVIELRFFQGLSVAETACRLGKSEAAIVAQTRRALDALREAMTRLGEFTRGT